MKIKKFTAVFFLISFSLLFKNLSAQKPFGQMDANNIAAGFNAAGDLFWDFKNAKFEVPKGKGVSAIFAANTWIGGLDESNQLHMAADTYRQSGMDFWAGPMAKTYSPAYDSKYNRIWKISKAQIENHKVRFAQASYVMPEVIQTWPGNGNVANGEAAVLAPYQDANMNGIYDPQNGDYPLIRGDNALYLIYNDDRKAHTESQGEKLGVEVHLMAYSFAPNGNSDLDNTLFINYKIHNRSQNNYKNVHLSNWVDFDLGYAFDDFVGSDTISNAFYAYNGDDMDEAGSGSPGYGALPPAIGFAALSTPLSAFMYFDNSVSGVTGNPQSAMHFYNYQRAIWGDGKHVVFGGSGYPGSPGTTAKETNFMFNAPAGWTEDGNNPGDRRGVGSVGPFALKAGTSECIDIAYVYARAEIGGRKQSVIALNERINKMHTFYAQQGFQCDSIKVNALKNANFSADNVYSCESLKTNFYDLSDSGAVAWQWSFPGASPGASVLKNPQNINYNSLGSFPVSLTVSYANGYSTSIRKENYINVTNGQANLSAQILGDTAKICEGDKTVIYSNLSGNIDSFEWYKVNGKDTVMVAKDVPFYSYQANSQDQFFIILYGSNSCNTNNVSFRSPIYQLNNVYPLPKLPVISLDNSTQKLLSNSNGTIYQWYLNGSKIAGATQTDHVASKVGYYTVVVSNAAGCSASSDKFFYQPVGINQLENKEIKITPNPNNGSFTVWCNAFAKSVSYQIFNCLGQLQCAGSAEKKSADGYKIDVENKLAPGLYFIELKQGRQTFTKQLIIN